MRRVLPVFLGAFAVSLFAAAPARANCYELIGCSNKDRYKVSDLMQLGCQPLWEVRNWIYKENGYCFRTRRRRSKPSAIPAAATTMSRRSRSTTSSATI